MNVAPDICDSGEEAIEVEVQRRIIGVFTAVRRRLSLSRTVEEIRSVAGMATAFARSIQIRRVRRPTGEGSDMRSQRIEAAAGGSSTRRPA
jgi:hypothetical protein